jgi:hypothetical protein
VSLTGRGCQSAGLRSRGVANRTLDGSKPDWNLIGHPEPPEGSPNVLLVLIDDAGFGNAGTFGTSGCTAIRPGPPARGFWPMLADLR